MLRFKVSQFFCWDLATGAKIIGSIGLLQHSLVILVIYRITIDLWVLSNDKKGSEVPTILYSIGALLLFIGLIVNILNLILSYRLFKVNETNQIQDLTNWINAELIYLILCCIYFVAKSIYADFGAVQVGQVVSFLFYLYCYVCVLSLREEYRQRAGLLTSHA